MKIFIFLHTVFLDLRMVGKREIRDVRKYSVNC